MKITAICLAVLFIAGCAMAIKEDETRREDGTDERHRDESMRRHGGERHAGERKDRVEHHREDELQKKESSSDRPKEEISVGVKDFKLEKDVKEKLVNKEQPEPEKHKLFINTMLDYVLNDESRKFERECFDNIKSGESIDFVIDIAPSPSQDKLDKMCAESPIAFFMDIRRQTPSQAYFNMIQAFIDAVTWQVKPEVTHSVIWHEGKKFFIRGKEIEASTTKSLSTESGDFSDSSRNLKTLWPVANKEVVSAFGEKQTKKVEGVIMNNLGRMTKLALWNRDNGLPTVLGATRHSKPIFTFVISDGASGAKLSDLTDDLSHTTVIDIGNRRFVKNIDWEDMSRLVNVVTLNAPQQIVKLIDTCRLLVAKSYGC